MQGHFTQTRFMIQAAREQMGLTANNRQAYNSTSEDSLHAIGWLGQEHSDFQEEAAVLVVRQREGLRMSSQQVQSMVAACSSRWAGAGNGAAIVARHCPPHPHPHHRCWRGIRPRQTLRSWSHRPCWVHLPPPAQLTHIAAHTLQGALHREVVFRRTQSLIKCGDPESSVVTESSNEPLMSSFRAGSGKPSDSVSWFAFGRTLWDSRNSPLTLALYA